MIRNLGTDLLEKVERLKMILTAVATGGDLHEPDFGPIRLELIDHPAVREKLPEFVLSCRTLHEFWGYIKPLSGTYQGRRQHIQTSFAPVLAMLESSTVNPIDQTVIDALSIQGFVTLQAIWRKALERRRSDPDGAITVAKTMMEALCKHILDAKKVSYDEKDELPRLFDRTLKHLGIAPSQQTEQCMKQILGGCCSVVNGVGTLRNRLGDAHGKGVDGQVPDIRYAELSVNIAGAVCSFLLATHQAQSIQSSADPEPAMSDQLLSELFPGWTITGSVSHAGSK